MGFDPLNKILNCTKMLHLRLILDLQPDCVADGISRVSAFALAVGLHTLGLRTWGNFRKR